MHIDYINNDVMTFQLVEHNTTYFTGNHYLSVYVCYTDLDFDS